MAALRSRVRRLHILKKAAGTRRLARIQSTGLAPSVLHGATGMGEAEHILKPVRTLAGVLAGAKAASSLTMTLVMQRSPRYDPIFKATLELPYMYASWLWDGKTSLVDLSQAWQAMVCNMQRAESWVKVTGPLSALRMTLRSVGWSMRSETGVITDENTHFSLLEVAPRDFRYLLEALIQRWQLRRKGHPARSPRGSAAPGRASGACSCHRESRRSLACTPDRLCRKRCPFQEAERRSPSCRQAQRCRGGRKGKR